MKRRWRTRFVGFHAGPPTPRQRLFGHAPSRAAAALWAGVAALLLASAGLHTHTIRLRAAQERLARASAAAPVAPAAPALSPAQQARWRLGQDQLNADWPGWFEALERHTPPEVVLRAIEPDAARRRLQVQGEADSLDTLLAWAVALAHEPRFAAVEPLRHDSGEGAPATGVRLTLQIGLADGEPAPGRP